MTADGKIEIVVASSVYGYEDKIQETLRQMGIDMDF